MYSVPNVLEVFANDVQYHLICWMHFQREVASEYDDTKQVIDLIHGLIADNHVINIA